MVLHRPLWLIGCLVMTGMLFSGYITAQQYTLFGHIVQDSTLEPLAGAHIYDADKKYGTAANNEGFFQLKLPAGFHMLEVSYAGYETQSLRIEMKRDTFVQVLCSPSILTEVVVRATPLSTRRPQVEVTDLPVRLLGQLPSLMGERDVLKSLAFFPGIGTGVEGKSDLLVRGGTSDQNLILYDDIPVYSTGHLFGFISIFNPTAVKSVKLYKGDFPAGLGGRLSSVIDIVSKDGQTNKVGGEYSLGLINSQFNVNGPLFSPKATFSLSGRVANLGLILLPTRILYETGRSDNYGNFFMYDINGKVRVQLNDKNYLSVAILTGGDRSQVIAGDYLDSESRGRFDWYNNLFSVKHWATVRPHWFTKTSLFLSGFRNETTLTHLYNQEDLILRAELYDRSRLKEFGLRHDNDFVLSSKAGLKVGAYLSRFENKTNEISINLPDQGETQRSPGLSNMLKQTALYGSFNYHAGPHLVETGLRFSHYSSSALSSFFLEPRFRYQYQVDSLSAISISYARLSQPLHLLAGLSTGLPSSSWVVAQENLPVASSGNVSLSYARSARGMGPGYELGLFYRRLKELSDFPLGAQFLFDTGSRLTEKLVTNGTGRAYGVEGLVRKDEGRTRGWLSGTWAISERRFDRINGGDWYPTQYHRRFDLKLFLNRSWSKGRSISTNVVWSDGYPVTFPEGFAWAHPDIRTIVPIYDRKNNYRSPNYFRVDVQYSKEYITKRGRNGTFSLGVYNISGHANPFTLEVKDVSRSVDRPELIEGVMTMSTLFNFIPYFTIGRKF